MSIYGVNLEDLMTAKMIVPHEISQYADYEFELNLYSKYELDDDIFNVGPGNMSQWDKNETDMFEWANRNCTGNVYYNGDMVFRFEFEDDRTAFKLTWG